MQEPWFYKNNIRSLERDWKVYWGSSDRNQRGVDLTEFLAGAHLTWCNVGNTLTFQVANRRKVLDLTLINDKMIGKVENWHVSNSPSLSDHALEGADF